MKRIIALVLILFTGSILWGEQQTARSQGNASPQAIQAPVLKWQSAGCYSSWCETGWYSSPAVADMDGDGQIEVIASAYSIVALDGATGNLAWRIASGHDRSEASASSVGRTWPGIVIADVDHDGSLEIVTAHSGGWVSVYNSQGYFKPGWPKQIAENGQPVSNELRGLAVADLDNNGDFEIIVTAARGSKVNTWVYEHNGALRPGWPQLNNNGGYAWGVYNANAAAADLDGDHIGEIIIPSDVHYINAYNPDGSHIAANAMYGSKNWGQVGIWESLAIELRGWGACDGVRAESYRTNFADGPANIVDLNGDGTMEVVVTGNVYDCDAGYPPSRYTGIYIFNADRSRFNTGGFDWRTVPVDTGAPISEDYNVIESAQSNPAVADLDGDGLQEIVFASYDGRVHAFWLDKSEHGNWPYSVYKPSEGYRRFASEPVIADLNNDGRAEVIFASWLQKSSNQSGKLHILNADGVPLYEVTLPAAFGSTSWNGALAAPTLANIDSDPDLEVVLNTAHSGVVAFDLPGTANALVLWGTGRGSFQRSGAILQGNLLSTRIQASTAAPAGGEIFTYTITLKNPNPRLDGVSLADTLPSGITYQGGLTASSGTAQVNGNTITWSGSVGPGGAVTISFRIWVDAAVTSPQALVNSAVVQDGLGRTLQRAITVLANGHIVYLPLIRH